MSFTDLDPYILKALDGGKWTVGYTYQVQNFGQITSLMPNPTWHSGQSTTGLEIVTGTSDIGVSTQPPGPSYLVWTVDYQTSGIWDSANNNNNIGTVEFPITTTEGAYTLTAEITIDQFTAPVITNITPSLPLTPRELLPADTDISLNYYVSIDGSFFTTTVFPYLNISSTVIFDTSLNIIDSNNNIIPTTVTLPSPVTAISNTPISQQITFKTPNKISTIENYTGTFLVSYTSPVLYQSTPGTGSANIANYGVTSENNYFSIPALIIPTIPNQTFTFYVRKEPEVFDLSLVYYNSDLADTSYNIKLNSLPNFTGKDDVTITSWPGYIYDNSTNPLNIGDDISRNNVPLSQPYEYAVDVKFAWPGNQYIGTSEFQIYAIDSSGGLMSDTATMTVNFEYLALNGCEWNPCLTAETSEWTRAHTDCVDLDGTAMTYQDLSEKRKATIFQYKNNSAGFSKKQQYSRIARGLGQKKTTYATQSDTYTNPNTNNLVLDASSVLLCPGKVKNWAYTSQNDTPGPMKKITNEPNVPLTNYKVRRTYLAGNNKWPQSGWAPGMDGFPVRKMGKK